MGVDEQRLFYYNYQLVASISEHEKSTMNPLYSDNDEDKGYLLPSSKIKAALQPISSPDETAPGAPKKGADPVPLSAAADVKATAELIRGKIEALYGKEEPDAKQELAEAESAIKRSKHQQFMHELNSSGKSAAEIQAAWHGYYAKLSAAEKLEVWDEFNAAQKEASQTEAPSSQSQPEEADEPSSVSSTVSEAPTTDRQPAARSIGDIRSGLLSKLKSRGSVRESKPMSSVVFGLATGSVVLIILLFGFFNERFIAPFITPSRNVSATPIIIDPNTTAVDPEPKVIVPKINVEIPVVYDVPGIEESDIQAALERGVVHYAASPQPGQLGNSVIVGHSSNNILNKGKYKFAFVLLNKLENGDVFYLTKDGKRYAYRVYAKKIVKPSDVEVLGKADKPATATLITCDPPGTSINRLVVIGEQISPDPNANVAGKPAEVAGQTRAVVPGNAPSLWQRLTGWLTS